MSENTPDSASGLAMDTSDMGTTDFDTGDNEPSMEDILASIRQIIADDEDEGTVDALDVDIDESFSEPETPVEAVQSETVETAAVQTDKEDPADILELMSFMDENSDEATASQAVPVESLASEEPAAAELTSDVSAEQVVGDVVEAASTVGFDESLDLVMDAEASDFLTTQVSDETGETEEVEFSLENELFADIERQNRADEESLIIPEIPAETEAKIETQAEDVTATPEGEQIQVSHDEDMDLVKSLLADLMDDEATEEVSPVIAEDGEDLHNDFEQALSDTIAVDEANETAEDGEGVDFVTGESMDTDALDALFDEDDPVVVEDVEPEAAIPDPEVEEVVENDIDMLQERDFVTGDLIDTLDEAAIFGDDVPSVLDEVLQKSIADEVAVHEKTIVAPAEPVAEPNPVMEVEPEEVIKGIDNSELPDVIEVSEAVVEVELAPEPQVVEVKIDEVTSDEDIVVLPEIDTNSKLSLLSKTAVGASALGLGAAAALMKNNDTETIVEETPAVIEETPVVEVPSVEPEALTQEQPELPPLKNETEKDETMAQAAKTETLLDTDTVADSASAFASLNTVVQEKTKMEESGPAIGDLVQDALKPMLKEWLDKNLKGIVERAVTKEVKRISSGK